VAPPYHAGRVPPAEPISNDGTGCATRVPLPDPAREDALSSRLIAWTGHRPDLFLDPAAAEAAVNGEAAALVHAGAHVFLVGGQRGVDTWAAMAAHRLGVPYRVLLPLESTQFAVDWTPADRDILDLTLSRAAEVSVVGGAPDAAYTERNRRLARECDLLIAVWARITTGGTAETIGFARAAGRPVHEVVLPAVRHVETKGGRGR
jgi:hypothetical protein